MTRRLHGGATIGHHDFAGGAEASWPGPALYGHDDWEANPVAARELCDALGRDENRRRPILCGTHEASVSENLAVPVPAELLKGARRLYVTESETVPGALFCQAASLRMDKVAELIKAEQTLEGYPWKYADEFEEEFSLYAFSKEVEIVDGMLPLRETSLMPDWARPGAKVVLLGVGDHFEIADTGQLAQSLNEWEDEISDLLGNDLE